MAKPFGLGVVRVAAQRWDGSDRSFDKIRVDVHTFVGDDLVEPLRDVGDQMRTARCVGEEVVAHLLVRALVVGDRASHRVIEVRRLDELLGGVDLCLLYERRVVEQCPQQAPPGTTPSATR